MVREWHSQMKADVEMALQDLRAKPLFGAEVVPRAQLAVSRDEIQVRLPQPRGQPARATVRIRDAVCARVRWGRRRLKT